MNTMLALSSKTETINIRAKRVPKVKEKSVVDCNIDDEWSSFITSHTEDLSDSNSDISDSDISDNESDIKEDLENDLKEDRDVFGNTMNSFVPKPKHVSVNKTHTHNESNNNSSNVAIPEPSDIYISTKSKIA